MHVHHVNAVGQHVASGQHWQRLPMVGKVIHVDVVEAGHVRGLQEAGWVFGDGGEGASTEGAAQEVAGEVVHGLIIICSKDSIFDLNVTYNFLMQKYQIHSNNLMHYQPTNLQPNL